MLAKENRLVKTKDFEDVFKRGKFFAEDFINLKVANNNLDISRFGFIVGLKVSKKAVRRNRVKRQIREIIRLRLDKIKKGFDVIIMAKPEIVGRSYKEIERVVDNILIKSKLI